MFIGFTQHDQSFYLQTATHFVKTRLYGFVITTCEALFAMSQPRGLKKCCSVWSKDLSLFEPTQSSACLKNINGIHRSHGNDYRITYHVRYRSNWFFGRKSMHTWITLNNYPYMCTYSIVLNMYISTSPFKPARLSFLSRGFHRLARVGRPQLQGDFRVFTKQLFLVAFSLGIP